MTPVTIVGLIPDDRALCVGAESPRAVIRVSSSRASISLAFPGSHERRWTSGAQGHRFGIRQINGPSKAQRPVHRSDCEDFWPYKGQRLLRTMLGKGCGRVWTQSGEDHMDGSMENAISRELLCDATACLIGVATSIEW